MAGSAFFTETIEGKSVPSWLARLFVWMLPVMFSGVAFVLLLQSFIWLQGAVEVTGTVTSVEERDFANDGEPALIYYSPVFSIQLENGTQASPQLALFGPDFNYETGSSHQIMVDPNLTTFARLPGFGFNYFPGVIALAIALMFLVISTLLWVWVRAIGRNRTTGNSKVSS